MKNLNDLKNQELASNSLASTFGGFNEDATVQIEWVTRTNVYTGSTGSMGTSADSGSYPSNADIFGTLSLDKKE